MATQNSINKFTQDLTIDPGTSGDSFLQFDINGTSEFKIGVDDDASDAFKISQGNALGTNDTFVMTDAGERTMPLQPAFLAYLSASDSNKTGYSLLYTLGSSGNVLTEVFDNNNDMSTTGTFTAPVTGRYMLGFTIRFQGFVAANGAYTNIVTSNRSYVNLNDSNPLNCMSLANGAYSINSITFADMDAADTAAFTLLVAGEASDIVDIVGGLRTYCYGYLVC